MFRVVEGAVTTRWFPVDGTDTLYEGQIVQAGKATTGVLPLGAASGAWDTTAKSMPFGIVVGASNRTPVYDTTWKANSIVQVNSQADLAARDNTGVEGQYIKGDPQAMVKVACIGPNSVIRGPIYNGAYGTAPTELVGTTAVTTGLGTTTDAIDFSANVAKYGYIYCRTGSNAGVYRVTDTSSTTVHTWTRAMPQDTAVGDTYVVVPFKPGLSQLTTDGESMYVDCSALPVIAGTDLWTVNIFQINLEVAGAEYVDFCFGATHFAPYSTRP